MNIFTKNTDFSVTVKQAEGAVNINKTEFRTDVLKIYIHSCKYCLQYSSCSAHSKQLTWGFGEKTLPL